jgi:hypothetical protein
VSSDGYAPALASRYVHALRNAGRLDDVASVGDEVLEIFPGFTDIVLEQALAARDADRQEALLRRCLQMGDGPSRYSATVGCGTYRPLVALAEVLRRRGAVEEAEETLRGCLREHPGFLAAVDPYAAALLRRGVPAVEVVEAVHAIVADASPSMRFLLAVALSEAGAVAEAEAELRAVLEAQPGNAHARVALAETLLALGRYADAAAEAASVDAEAPCAAAAQRTELFALLTDGAPADAGAAVALPDEERAVFAAWEAVRCGANAPAALPAQSAAPVLIMLDALARLQAFDAFEALAGVLEAVAMPWRERRQALAELYLRHGYADSAAEEWIAACEQGGVDVEALRGLAAVAVARGLDEDAQVFAAEAEALAAA